MPDPFVDEISLYLLLTRESKANKIVFAVDVNKRQ